VSAPSNPKPDASEQILNRMAATLGGRVLPAGAAAENHFRSYPNGAALMALDLLDKQTLEVVAPWLRESIEKMLANPAAHDPEDTMCRQFILEGADGVRGAVLVTRGPRWIGRVDLASGRLLESGLCDDVISIACMTVAPKWCRKGVGSLLMSTVISSLGDIGSASLAMGGPLSDDGLAFVRGIDRKHIKSGKVTVSYCGPEALQMQAMATMQEVFGSILGRTV
jgi:hypothetical protein